LSLTALSSPAADVAGGELVVQLHLPIDTAAGSIRLVVDGRTITTPIGVDHAGRTVARITGLPTGSSQITASSGTHTATLAVVNHPIAGPVFSGAHLPLAVCDTQLYGLGPAADADCSAPTQIHWRYRSTNGH